MQRHNVTESILEKRSIRAKMHEIAGCDRGLILISAIKNE